VRDKGNNSFILNSKSSLQLIACRSYGDTSGCGNKPNILVSFPQRQQMAAVNGIGVRASFVAVPFPDKKTARLFICDCVLALF